MSNLKTVLFGENDQRKNGQKPESTSENGSKRCDWTSEDTTRPISWSIPIDAFDYIPTKTYDIPGMVSWSKGTIIFDPNKLGDYTYKVLREAFGKPDKTLQPKASDKVWREKVKFLVKDDENNILYLIRPIHAKNVYASNITLQADAHFRIELNVIGQGHHYEMESFADWDGLKMQ